jgi:uncharacterized LabA/DUF88 family protein
VIPVQAAPLVANFYVDGFNLYNGCLRGSPYRWLDLQSLSAALAPGRTVGLIRYFTARVSGSAARRQQVYLDALASLPSVTVHTEGHFETHTVIRPLAKTHHPSMTGALEWLRPRDLSWLALPWPKPGRDVRASVRDTKEKGTDVNLATLMLADAYSNGMTEIFVVSGDSDLALPVKLVGALMPVTVVNPVFGRRSAELQAAAGGYTTLNAGILAASQLPTPITLPTGRSVSKPAGW